MISFKAVEFNIPDLSGNVLVGGHGGDPETQAKIAIKTLGMVRDAIQESLDLGNKNNGKSAFEVFAKETIGDDGNNGMLGEIISKWKEIKGFKGEDKISPEDEEKLSDIYIYLKSDPKGSYGELIRCCSVYIKSKHNAFYTRLRLAGIKKLQKASIIARGILSKRCEDVEGGPGTRREANKSRDTKAIRILPVEFNIPTLTELSFLNENTLRALNNAIKSSYLKSKPVDESQYDRHPFQRFTNNITEHIEDLIDRIKILRKSAQGDSKKDLLDIISSGNSRVRLSAMTLELYTNITKECDIYLKSKHNLLYSKNRINGVKKIKESVSKSADIINRVVRGEQTQGDNLKIDVKVTSGMFYKKNDLTRILEYFKALKFSRSNDSRCEGLITAFSNLKNSQIVVKGKIKANQKNEFYKLVSKIIDACDEYLNNLPVNSKNKQNIKCINDIKSAANQAIKKIDNMCEK